VNYIFDIECYRNYFLLVLIPVGGGEPLFYERFNDVVTMDDLSTFDFAKATLVGFNSLNYDFPVWGGVYKGMTNAQLKEVSDAIILNGLMPWDVEREFGLLIPPYDHIDINQILPLRYSLKIYGGRIHYRRLQDLPIEPGATITPEQTPELRKYCINDCEVTLALYNEVKPQIDLRITMGEQYGLDLRSKSDAQIAEAVIASEYQRITGHKLYKPDFDMVPKPYSYKPPSFVLFQTPQMTTLLDDIRQAVFTIKESNGQVELPPVMKNAVQIGQKEYQLGIGGLHSVDGPGSYHADDYYEIYDIDVAAYYPSIILNAGYYPTHIGEVFLDIYKHIVNTRLEAKRCGDKVTDASLKIVINGTFGKLGSKWSKVYSPDLMFHVTVTGQLCLLMLIEQLPTYVLSANTDGITVRVPKGRMDTVRALVADWERQTGLVMEWTRYRSFCQRDCNNYLAIKDDGSVKLKGVFAPPNIGKNPVNTVIYRAVKDYFLEGIPAATTINDSHDINEFTSLRTVKGGAVWGGQVLGKSVRWYHSWLSASTINYITNGNKVPLTDASVPLMDLPQKIPFDLDRQWYINEAEKLLGSMDERVKDRA